MWGGLVGGRGNRIGRKWGGRWGSCDCDRFRMMFGHHSLTVTVERRCQRERQSRRHPSVLHERETSPSRCRRGWWCVCVCRGGTSARVRVCEFGEGSDALVYIHKTNRQKIHISFHASMYASSHTVKNALPPIDSWAHTHTAHHPKAKDPDGDTTGHSWKEISSNGLLVDLTSVADPVGELRVTVTNDGCEAGQQAEALCKFR